MEMIWLQARYPQHMCNNMAQCLNLTQHYEKGPRLPDMGTVLASQNICGMHVSYHALNKNNTMNKGYNYAITPSLRALTSPSLLQPG